ncbi:hypothetical protein QU38_00805, partial [Staphylococcus aureus]
MPAPSPGMEPACRLLQADADAGAELTAEHVRIGGVRRHAGFRHQQRPAVEQVGDVDEELRLVAAEAHRLRQVQVDVEQARDPVVVIGREIGGRDRTAAGALDTVGDIFARADAAAGDGGREGL